MTFVANPDTTLVNCDEIPWAEMAPGIELKMLRIGDGTGRYTLMTRFAPGTQLPRHRHFGEVHAYTIQGRWRYLEYDWIASAGDFVYEPVSSTHTLKVPDDNEEPTIVIFTVDKGMVMLGDEDELLMIEDGEGLNDLYRVVLESTDREYPAGVLP